MEDKASTINRVVDIVSAFVSKNSLPGSELPALITSVHKTLTTLDLPTAPVAAEPLQPAVSIKKSLGTEYLICLEDGRKFKSLKRHLRTKYNLSPEEYRAKWNLPKDYPMVAPAYAEARSNLAKQMGLGQGGRAASAAKRGRKPRAV